VCKAVVDHPLLRAAWRPARWAAATANRPRRREFLVEISPPPVRIRRRSGKRSIRDLSQEGFGPLVDSGRPMPATIGEGRALRAHYSSLTKNICTANSAGLPQFNKR
jgi:hypothetical protein